MLLRGLRIERGLTLAGRELARTAGSLVRANRRLSAGVSR